jgi:hypothetical protein
MGTKPETLVNGIVCASNALKFCFELYTSMDEWVCMHAMRKKKPKEILFYVQKDRPFAPVISEGCLRMLAFSHLNGQLGGISSSLVPQSLSFGPTVNSSKPPLRKNSWVIQLFVYGLPFSFALWI